MNESTLTHYALYKFTDFYWQLNTAERGAALRAALIKLEAAAETVWHYQVSPAQTDYDILIWSNAKIDSPQKPNQVMRNMASAISASRAILEPVQNFWGLTRPSQYSKAKRSPQELDPFTEERMPYFIIYPFSKTKEWYLKPREERQEMMNEHIRIGKSYPDITQLLLYSFGLQDQEFVVAYETEDLAQFSILVNDLRATDARIYTLLDTPITLGMYRTIEELVDIYA